MMTNDSVQSQIIANLESLGFKARMVSMEHLQDLKSVLESTREQEITDAQFNESLGEWFDFALPEDFPKVQSIIIVAVPQPAVQLDFTVNGQTIETIVPPTYIHNTDQKAYECINQVVNPKGYALIRAPLTEKHLAASSGLAKYGKNNITYVEGMGSFHRPVAFYTDAPTTEDHWQEPQMLERCHDCVACANKCPTHAISKDRFLLHAEKCLTFFNEDPVPFPDWIDPSWHHCLVGCMICQRACLENKSYVNWVEHVATFTEEETELILQYQEKSYLPDETKSKIFRVNMFKDLNMVSRNLKALINQQE